MKPRHQAREVALQILYRYDVALASQHAAARPTPTEAIAELSNHFEHFQVPEEVREFAGQLVAGTLLELVALDVLLEKYASNWKVARMGFVDRSLLRMSLYELIHHPETPPSVVIDEAVELGKHFGTAETPAFVNGILDAIKRAMQAGELKAEGPAAEG